MASLCELRASFQSVVSLYSALLILTYFGVASLRLKGKDMMFILIFVGLVFQVLSRLLCLTTKTEIIPQRPQVEVTQPAWSCLIKLTLMRQHFFTRQQQEGDNTAGVFDGLVGFNASNSTMHMHVVVFPRSLKQMVLLCSINAWSPAV